MMPLTRRLRVYTRLVIAVGQCLLLTSALSALFIFSNVASASVDQNDADITRTNQRSVVWPSNFTSPSDLGHVEPLDGKTRKLPDAIIIGVKKGGTRALLEFLKVHPDIRAPGPEIHFFDRQYRKGLDWYRSRMPATLDGQLTVEKTPSYFVTRSVPRRVHNSMSPNTKLIVVVREPVARALSDYTQARLKRPDLPSFEMMAFGNASDGTVNRSWGAIRIGLYARHLDRWLRRFPITRFHFVSGERLVADPGGELGRLQDFLGLKRLVTDKHFYFNATKGFPCLKKAERGGTPRCLGQSKGRAHPVIDDSAVRRLRDFYRPHNRRFYDMTGVDFGWD